MKKIRYIPYGYAIKNGKIVIVNDEAEIIKKIFELYINGASLKDIANKLTSQNVQYTEKTTKWDKARISRIMENTKYLGMGEYAPIIGADIYRKAIERKSSKQRNVTSELYQSVKHITHHVRCGKCGGKMMRKVFVNNTIKECWIWRCTNRLDNGKTYCKHSITVSEKELHQAIVRAVNKFNKEDEATYMSLMKATIGEAIGLAVDSDEVDLLKRRIDELNKKMLDLVNESVRNGGDIETHEEEFKELSAEIDQLKKRIQALEESESSDIDRERRLSQLQNIIVYRKQHCDEYDDSIVRQMIECIKIYSNGELQIIFGGGHSYNTSLCAPI